MKLVTYLKEEEWKGFSLPVDLIRSFAIISVILIHASIESYASMPLDNSGATLYLWTASAYQSVVIVGVPLFAMLSGALLLQPSKTNEPIRVFLKKRLSRLGLAFGFWSAAYFAWAYLFDSQPLSLNSLIQGLFVNGAYYHFWFFYLIAGLYLATPILRLVVSNADTRMLRYMILLWFTGASVMPLVQLMTGVSLNSDLFLFNGYIGYFILGSYLQRIKIRSSILLTTLVLGIIWTLVGTWFMIYPFHALGNYYFFFNTLSINVILVSVSIFMILKKSSVDWPGKTRQHLRIAFHAISAYTLPIFLLHVLILESLQRGYLGFTLSLTKMNPIIEIPTATIVTLFITLGLILGMKRVPILKTLIG
jgi:surface polysaccharide O-acyltransferase-like enzyme